MPTLEQVCKRLFADPHWFVKCMLGALLLAIPIAHFFAFGYIYAMVQRARRGEALQFPEWTEWARLFTNGIAAFLIFLVLGVAPIFVCWLLTLPLRLLAYGAFVYVPLVPAVLLAGPLTAAGLYQFQKREEYRDAFRIPLLFAMLRSTKARLYVPTFAIVGFHAAGYPLLTFTVFVGLAIGLTFYAAFFRGIEESRKSGLRSA